jgi:hypothetical protein
MLMTALYQDVKTNIVLTNFTKNCKYADMQTLYTNTGLCSSKKRERVKNRKTKVRNKKRGEKK